MRPDPGAAWAGRSTRAEVDLDALAGNVRALKALLPPDAAFMAVVKANAYGHGARQVAKTALDAGASHLAVATVGEARELRSAGIAAPVLILGPVDRGEVPEALRLDVQLTVTTPELLDAVLDAATSLGRPAQAHVKIDTGLNRYGAAADLAFELARRVHEHPALELAGVFTHFAESEIDDLAFTREQQAMFLAFADRLDEAGIPRGMRHQLNSGGIAQGLDAVEMARAGIVLYGVSPDRALPLPPGVRPLMRMRSRIARTFEVEPGATVGYNRTWRAERRERAALVPIGYADGYRRSFSSRAWMSCGTDRLEVIGRVSMDQTVVRIPPGCGPGIGEEVLVFGDGSSGAPDIHQLAELAGTNTYELLVSVAARVPRVYVAGGRIVDVEERLA